VEENELGEWLWREGYGRVAGSNPNHRTVLYCLLYTTGLGNVVLSFCLLLLPLRKYCIVLYFGDTILLSD
jgi:hypothetical protein